MHKQNYLSMETVNPVWVVTDLKHGANNPGTIGLWVDIGTEGNFADLRVNIIKPSASK